GRLLAGHDLAAARRCAVGIRVDSRFEPGHGVFLAAPLGLFRRDAARSGGAALAWLAAEPAGAWRGGAWALERYAGAAGFRLVRRDGAAKLARDGRAHCAGLVANRDAWAAG